MNAPRPFTVSYVIFSGIWKSFKTPSRAADPSLGITGLYDKESKKLLANFTNAGEEELKISRMYDGRKYDPYYTDKRAFWFQCETYRCQKQLLNLLLTQFASRTPKHRR